jgi:hypothetical protein
MKKLLLLLALATVTFSSCSDATSAKISASGNPHRVEVISGGKVARTYLATGKVQSEAQSDGYYFMDAKTGSLIELSGDVIITTLPYSALDNDTLTIR